MAKKKENERDQPNRASSQVLPYSTIAEVEQIVTSHLPAEILRPESKDDEVLELRKIALKIGRALEHLDYRVTLAKCSGNLNVLFVSEFRLVDPRTKKLKTEILEEIDDKFQGQYSELRMRAINQRTFTWQAKNKHGTWAGLTELGFVKFWTRKYEILKHFNINYRSFRFAPIVFVDSSDGQRERLKQEGTRIRKERIFPDDVDISLIKRSYDLTLFERAMTQLKLVVEDAIQREKRHEDELNNVRDDSIFTAAEQVHNYMKSGRLRIKPPSRLVELWNEHIRSIVKYLVILLIIWVIASVIHAFITETPLFSYLQPDNIPTGGGSDAIPDTGGTP